MKKNPGRRERRNLMFSNLRKDSKYKQKLNERRMAHGCKKMKEGI